MSIEQIAANLTARIVAPAPKVITLDIERLPGLARLEHRGLTIEGPFWDLSQWKHTIGYRIHPDHVLAWPRTICVAWKDYTKNRVEFASEWDDGPEAMFRRVWDAYDAADVVYGHNVDRFDGRHLNTAWRDLGLPPPSPVKYVDTLKEARKMFGDESMRLDALTARMGVATKTDSYSVEVAQAACDGDKAAQRRIKSYNIGDVRASEALVDRMRPWLSTHPHMGPIVEDVRRCNACGSTDLERNGTTRAIVIDYVLYRCGNCGANVKGTRHSRSAVTRGVR